MNLKTIIGVIGAIFTVIIFVAGVFVLQHRADAMEEDLDKWGDITRQQATFIAKQEVYNENSNRFYDTFNGYVQQQQEKDDYYERRFRFLEQEGY